jgi:hypothetical protein
MPSQAAGDHGVALAPDDPREDLLAILDAQVTRPLSAFA